jgi:hypothetical protein
MGLDYSIVVMTGFFIVMGACALVIATRFRRKKKPGPSRHNKDLAE